ncbi:phage scaffolding protein [Paenibacillus urinalis]|uniref:phage scaffolding protein n=1 Tax=Paenibacillus urinalis TaxID=521520 RepID=UPI00195F36BD
MKNVRFPLNLQLFAGEPDPPPPLDPPADPQPPKTFTQDEVDRLITDRLSRERKKYGDYDDLKTKLTEFEQAEEERKKAEMSAHERLEAEKAEALKAADEAKAERDQALTAANQRLIKAEFRALARELNVRKDAIDDALKLADLSAVTVDDEGNAVGVEDVVKALIENKPFLVEQTKSKPDPIGGASGGEQKPEKTKDQLLAEMAEKVKANPTPSNIAKFTQLKRELNK